MTGQRRYVHRGNCECQQLSSKNDDNKVDYTRDTRRAHTGKPCLRPRVHETIIYPRIANHDNTSESNSINLYNDGIPWVSSRGR